MKVRIHGRAGPRGQAGVATVLALQSERGEEPLVQGRKARLGFEQRMKPLPRESDGVRHLGERVVVVVVTEA